MRDDFMEPVQPDPSWKIGDLRTTCYFGRVITMTVGDAVANERCYDSAFRKTCAEKGYDEAVRLYQTPLMIARMILHPGMSDPV